MKISFIIHQLRYELDQADQKLSLYLFMGWDTEWPMFWRHMLIEALAKQQLKEWDHG